MVEYNKDDKDDFTQSTQVQNVGRIFMSATYLTKKILLELINEAKENNSIASINNINESLWIKTRSIREFYLKGLTLLVLKNEKEYIDQLVNIGAKLHNVRESIRWRTAEFYEIQWPPKGCFAAPTPKLSIEPAINTIVLKNAKLLPKYTNLAINQINSSADVFLQSMKLSKKRRHRIQNELTQALMANFALSIKKKDTKNDPIMRNVEFSVINSRVYLYTPHEYEIIFITDLRKFQFESMKNLVGVESCNGCGGYKSVKRHCTCYINQEFSIMGCNTISSCINIINESLECLRARLQYELNSWKAAINASKDIRIKIKNLYNVLTFANTYHEINSSMFEFDYNSLKALVKEDLINMFESNYIINRDKKISINENDITFLNSSEEDEKLNNCDFNELILRLYEKMRNLEWKFIEKLEQARKNLQLIESNDLLYEYYRFICLFGARQSRLTFLLLLYEQIKVMSNSIISPGGIIMYDLQKISYENNSKIYLEYVKKFTNSNEHETTTNKYIPDWFNLFWKYFPSIDQLSIAEMYPEIAIDIPFSCLFFQTSLPIHIDLLTIDFFPALNNAYFHGIMKDFNDVVNSKLHFTLYHPTALLSVDLFPCNSIIESENVDQRYIDSISIYNEFKFFYNKKENKYRSINTNDVNIIADRGIILRKYIDNATKLLAHMSLIALKFILTDFNQPNFTYKYRPNLLEIYYCNIRAISICIDYRSGNLVVNALDIYHILGDDYTLFLDTIYMNLKFNEFNRLFASISYIINSYKNHDNVGAEKKQLLDMEKFD